MPINSRHEGVSLLGGCLPWLDIDEKDFDLDEGRFAFSRGFVIADRALKINKHFSERARIGDTRIYCHRDLGFSCAERGDFVVCILGTSYFIQDYGKKDAEILLDSLEESYESFLETTSRLCGRYVIFASDWNRKVVLNDPCGLRCVYYSASAGIVGSHLELVQKFAKADLSSMEKLRRLKGYIMSGEYPGYYTKYAGIKMLLPDFVLELGSFATKRFYPFEKLEKSMDVWTIKENVRSMMRDSLLKLKAKKKVCMSMSDGKDSKVTFYCISDMTDDMFFLTESRDNDLAGARKVMEEHGCRWIGSDSKDLDFRGNSMYEAYRKIVEQNVFPLTSTDALQNHFWNLNLFGVNEWIAIHSNCSEVGRGRGYEYLGNGFTFEEYLRCFIDGSVAWKGPAIAEKQKAAMSSDEEFVGLMREFFDSLDLGKAIELGYDPWDFVYSEQRVAGFLSQTHMCFDPSYESVSLTNSRDILEEMWRIPEKYRSGKFLLYRCILNEHDSFWKEKHMGKDFVPNDDHDLYGEVYGGYIMCEVEPEREDEILEKVVESNPTVKWARFSKLKRDMDTGSLDLPVDLYDAVSRDPEFVETDIFKKAFSSLRFDGVDEEKEYLDLLVSANPMSTIVIKHYANILWKENTKESLSRYVEILKPLSDSGNSWFEGMMGRALLWGKGTDADLGRSIALLRDATSSDLFWSNELFDALWKAETPDTDEEMIEVARRYAEKGSPDAYGRLGKAYRYGRGVETDLERSRSCYERAAAGNSFWSRYLDN